MARGLNSITLIGNLTDKPDFMYTANGDPLARVTMAVNGLRQNNEGAREESVEYFRLIFFERSAETVGKLCSKGGKMWVQGRLQTRPYTDREGLTRTAIEVVVKEFLLLSGHNEREKDQNQKGNDDVQ